MQFHLIREAVSMKQLNIVDILTSEMAADRLTKSLPASDLLEFRRMIDIDKSS